MQHPVIFDTLIARLLTFLTAFMLIGTGGYAALDTPAVTPHPVQKAPLVDGVLDDAVWEHAPRYEDFRAGSSAARAITAAQIAWDGEAFYVGFRCKAGPDIKTVYHQDGDPVWQDESVELFIAPWNAPSMAGLYHFTVSAAGVKTFLRAEQANEKRDWHAAVSRTSDGWTCEMRIPLSLFDEQGPNEPEWRILFCRNSSELDESSSWPASGGRFANFWNYARLVPPDGKPSFTRFRAHITPREGHGPRGIQPLKQAAIEQSERPVIIPEPVYARFHPSTRFE
ncbi:MAG: sugar-binding protein, partial [Armatimonadota bacterium]